MPLDYSQVWKKLEANVSKFKEFDKDLNKELNALKKASGDIFKKSYNDIINALNNMTGSTGARPSREYKNGLLVKFNSQFNNLKEMVAWAVNILENKVCIGTDGSQIYAPPEINMPIGLVQVVCFINEHNQSKNSYKEDREIRILAPKDLLYERVDKKTGSTIVSIGEEPVNAMRYKIETDLLTKYLDMYHNKQPKISNIYAITDGSLVLSFLQRMSPDTQNTYYAALKDALKKSKHTKHPLIGYVDSSAAKDVVDMLKKLDKTIPKDTRYISDAYILENYITQSQGLNYTMNWGDRTCAFICDRQDGIYDEIYPDKIGKKYCKIAFFYIKLSSAIMARVEFPAWTLREPGMVENIANIMRAESAIGSGYPYTIDKCHHLAVIKGQERLKFLRLFQKFGKQNNIKIGIKNKAKSKLVRI
ncbi:MAG: hypothetical protein GF364_11780 [Candidatus Lokiarchaeota archaeon]|nr:hypothetical protein [Candidatus Lokiarchaeota archaeon]